MKSGLNNLGSITTGTNNTGLNNLTFGLLTSNTINNLISGENANAVTLDKLVQI